MNMRKIELFGTLKKMWVIFIMFGIFLILEEILFIKPNQRIGNEKSAFYGLVKTFPIGKNSGERKSVAHWVLIPSNF